MKKTLVLAGVVTASIHGGPSAAQPFGRSGGQFRVNTTTAGYQWVPDVGMDATGGFLVTWKTGLNGDLDAQRYAASGAPIGGEFVVGSSTAFAPRYASVLGQSAGEFLVVWENGGAPTRIYAQRVQAGVPAGAAFRVDTGATAYDQRPAVATTANGDFAVVWGRSPTSSNNWDLFGRRVTSGGAPVGDEFHVSSSTTSQHSGAPFLARALDGSFLVAWTPNSFPAQVDAVFIRRYSAAGVEGPIEPVNDPFSTGSTTPGAAYDSAGNFVIVWGGGLVWGQRYDASGAALGGIFQVSTNTTNPPIATTVGSDSAGNFVVVWGNGNVFDSYTIYGRRFASSGAPLGDIFQVNTATSGKPRLGGIAMDGAGNFVVVWSQGGYPNADVYGQLFCAAVAGDANGDGHIDVSDVFYLVNALFAGGPAPLRGSDANGDGKVDVMDVFFLINSLFAAGPAPACVPAT